MAPDGSLSGPGMACTTVAKQTYALPPRPDLSGGMGSASSAPAQPQGDVLPVSNATLKSDDTTGAPVSSSGFLGAPTTLAPGVLESNEPTPAPQTAPVSAPVTAPATATPVSAPAAAAPVSAPVSAPAAAASGRFVVRRRRQRSNACAAIPTAFKPAVQRTRRVIQNGAVWRIQLGPLPVKPKPARYSNVCKQKHNYSPLSPARSNRSQVSVLSISVNDINKVTRKVRCLPVMLLL